MNIQTEFIRHLRQPALLTDIYVHLSSKTVSVMPPRLCFRVGKHYAVLDPNNDIWLKRGDKRQAFRTYSEGP